MEMLPLCPGGLQDRNPPLLSWTGVRVQNGRSSPNPCYPWRNLRPGLYHEVEAELGLRHQLELCLPRSRARAWQAQVCWSASRGPCCCL